MNISEMKSIAIKEIESKRDDLISIGRELYAMPEPGFREHRTSTYVKKCLENIGLTVEDEIAVTGLKAKAEGRSHDVCTAVMGELDALIMPGHYNADPITGAAHACGHHAQLTMLIGTAIGLVSTGIIKELDGDVTFLAVPAEEVIELEFRRELAEQQKIRFYGGKQEFIRLGMFDDVDAVLCGHISSAERTDYFCHSASYNGILYKTVHFIGKSSHAGLAPQLGINALQAAVCAINNINALRETLSESEYVRIHYIITKGGDSPNIVPDDVRMEFGVRAASSEAMMSVNQRVNAALRAGAAAVGAQVEINDIGAYLPTRQDKGISLLFADNAKSLVGDENVDDMSNIHRCSSTDVGDVTSFKPTIHPNFGGAIGTPHTSCFDISDEGFAYVAAAKAMVMTVIDLLADDGKIIKDIRNGFKPIFADKKKYLGYFDKLFERNT